MKRILASLAGLLLVAAALCGEETLRFGRFGTVTVYRTTPRPTRMVLFASGDGGWNQGVVDMARSLAALDSVVIGFDTPALLRALGRPDGACSYPAEDLEALSHFVQKSLEFPDYRRPVLVGYSSGATLVYLALAQAPPGTFAGAMSLGFCPDLPLPKPPCRGSGLEWEMGPRGKTFVLHPARALRDPWIALQGGIDQVCDADATERFVARTANSSIVLLPKVGHGFAVQRNWMPQFKEAFSRLAEAAKPSVPTDATVGDLPLVEIPSTSGTMGAIAVILSGDGGWAGVDRDLAGALATKGVSVIGFDSLRYFWTKRTPEGASRDLERVLRHYLNRWKKERVLLVGYSMGAEVLPFLVARLPADLRSRIVAIALLAPGRTASFEFHVAEWLGAGAKDEQPVLPELKRLEGLRTLCFYGEDEKDSLCPQVGPRLGIAVALPGGHHFGGDYESITNRLLEEVR